MLCKKLNMMICKLLACSLLLFFFGSSVQAESRAELWKRVKKSTNDNLPQSAIKDLDLIIEGTQADQAWPEYIKAVGQRVTLEGTIQGNKPEERVIRLEAAIAKAPPQAVPILNTLLAEYYWQYFQSNQWQFVQRTQTGQPPGKDFTTWDLKQIYAKIDQTFARALSDESLKTIPIKTYVDLFIFGGETEDACRPTLYDFIAYEALNFYASAPQAGAKPEDAFELVAESDLFAPTETFMNWKPETTDSESPKYKAIRLYQELIKFHLKDQEPSALIDAEMARLVFARNFATGESTSKRFQSAMEKITQQWKTDPLSSVAYHHWATSLHSEKNSVKARQLAEVGAALHPKSVGAARCRNLIRSIEAPDATIITEGVWNAPAPEIRVTYRNLSKVYFRAIPWDWDYFLDSNRQNFNYFDESTRNKILATKPALEWVNELPPTKNYQVRTEALPSPASLKPGFYFIAASHDPQFKESVSPISITKVWVSDLALILRPRANAIEGFVRDSKSGTPTVKALVESWKFSNKGNWVKQENTTTDANGMFSIRSAESYRQHRFRVRSGEHTVASDDQPGSRDEQSDGPTTQVTLFTDRSIYRPGQKIQFKGIVVDLDQKQGKYQTRAGRSIKVRFLDTNGKEIDQQKFTSNDYGSFSGAFTSPTDRLNGIMTLETSDGSTMIRVEEYKRPKFQVTLEAPKTASRLAETVSLEGKAISYAGAAMDNSKVSYRVVRNVRMPWWWGCFSRGGFFPQRDSQEIAHGTTRTATDGTFKINFMANPDRSILEANEPIFTYQVFADVTDSSGETRSDSCAITLGYTALEARMTASDWQAESEPISIKLQTQTLDGVAQSAKGKVVIYKLRAPATVQRGEFQSNRDSFYHGEMDGASSARVTSESNTWPLGEVVTEQPFSTDEKGLLSLSFKLPVGYYRASLETRDRFGKKVTGLLPLQVFNPTAKKFTSPIPNVVSAPTWNLEPGSTFTALWGSGYETSQAFVEIEHRDKIIQSYWTPKDQTQSLIQVPITETLRGGFTLHITHVRENRAYLETRRVEVPWTNKELQVRWEHFTSKLTPGQNEVWTAIVQGPKAGKAVAEMVATLYDESLDSFAPHPWIEKFSFFHQDFSSARPQFINQSEAFRVIKGSWPYAHEGETLHYRRFPYELQAGNYSYRAKSYGLTRGLAESRDGELAPTVALSVPASQAPATRGLSKSQDERESGELMAVLDDADAPGGASAKAGSGPSPKLNQVQARKNLNETAFFFPHLMSEKNGEIRISFTMPEALTRWKLMGFAHDTECRSGFLTGSTVTQKDLMVQPNPPRFLREGDLLEFTVKVSNLTDIKQQGKARLTFADSVSEKEINALLANKTIEQSFTLPAKQSQSLSWRVTVPDGLSLINYKAVAATDKMSDGEEGILPVLSKRIYVTESMTLPIRGPQEKDFLFNRLIDSGKSSTLRPLGATAQMVSNPSWYAVMALPYLMEFPHECSEQTFNRLYANALARHIANSDPKIRKVFNQWKGTDALKGPLEKNADLKSIALQETPWVQEADKESTARRQVGILFQQSRLDREVERTLQKLSEMQHSNGLWPWFPGGYGNEYITLYITTGFGRLRNLGVEMSMECAVKSLGKLDDGIQEQYREIVAKKWESHNNLTPSIAFYLYGRSFFLKDRPIDSKHKKSVDYFLGQAEQFGLSMGNRQSRAHLALGLHRFGRKEMPVKIMKSLQEHALNEEEMGMFWRDTEISASWFHAPIETQALMMEAFDEIMNDTKSVEDCKVWLLKQKQTQDWKTTKATADAIYALLLRGESQLASDALVEMTVGGEKIKPEVVEAGTGFYEKKWSGSEVRPEMGKIHLKKSDKGVAWGSIHWRYLEDISKVTAFAEGPLKLNKKLFLKTATKKGPVLEEIKGSVAVGAEIVVRVELRSDRDMEFLHLKDQRGSGVEPVNVLSHFKFQDGLGYYESTRDTASHFYIDYLPKGAYVFEYPVRVVHRGAYQSGMAEIQCMYAPEFQSHSESVEIQAK